LAVRDFFAALTPGGYFLVYNVCPAQTIRAYRRHHA
jgi:hypothetical protein